MPKALSAALKAVKWLCIAVSAIILIAVVVVIVSRGITYVQNRIFTENGVDEGIYVDICGQEQYIRIRGENVDNPVIIYLHGGPAGPDGYIAHYWQKYLLDDYTLISWDQRGCGRTYYRNKKSDPDNKTATFEQALYDLDGLVDYVSERFGKDKVIILGHSYGTLLGSQYALSHPERVEAYIGVGQFVSMESELYAYEDALRIAEEKGDDTTDLTAAFDDYISAKNGGTDVNAKMIALRSLTSPYHMATDTISSSEELWLGLSSPYMSFNDLRWYLRPMLDLDGYFELNSQLFDCLGSFDLREDSLSYDMPVYFISGSCDWITPVKYTADYLELITAPDKAMFLIEGSGHYPLLDKPEEFCGLVKEALAS